jgi:hypothetical protein
MWFYHEGYQDAYYAEAVLDDFRSRDRREDDQAYEPIRMRAILNWLVVVSIALCVIVAAINGLS